jgi:Na+-translocating ferredoxin:NAD+ oxidoreductase RnfA subunit
MAIYTFVAILLALLLTEKKLMTVVLGQVSLLNFLKDHKTKLQFVVLLLAIGFFFVGGLLAVGRFLLAIAFFASIRIHLDFIPVPKLLKGLPILLLSALVVLIVFFGLR